ncbi:MAG TPA: hypothetical protein VH280_10140 [Verrucomicrobiae bacterium]|nr:hypothetical protein [Verrucomicrobiae bacterium]
MKTPGILIPGAFGLLFSIAVTSCSSGGSSCDMACSAPAKTSATTTAPAASPSASAAALTPASTMTVAGATPVSLASAFNLVGIVPDDTQFSDSLDGDGFDCSSNLLHNSYSWKGVPFELGTANKGANVVSCNGQTIALPAGKFSKMEMLATAVNGAQASQTFTITYADASLNQTKTQSLSDWFQPDSNAGESATIDMDHRVQSDGTRDDQQYYIYGYTFDLNLANTPTSLVLPSNNNVKVFAVTLVP